MRLLNRDNILASLAENEQDTLFIDPLLDEAQIGAVSVDLRLGYDFQVSILTRKPSINVYQSETVGRRGIGSYFQETRRQLGDAFVLYPHQIVLATTLEYVSLPSRMYADVLARSSYARLGIQTSTMIQPGFRGCFPIELFNHSNTPVEIVVGSRLLQARLFEIDVPAQYLGVQPTRKYFGAVRPTVSRADRDPELERLAALRAF
ncbi:dCTP deaminase [Burkholderia gladioli]|uniref:dCTP deaminase n=1 Tax=Burkholderia gladioli TaxID=28095 RepID=UPI003D7C27EB